MSSPAASARTYLVLFAEAPLEEGEIYKFNVEVKTPGSGLVGYVYGTYGDFLLRTRKIQMTGNELEVRRGKGKILV